MISPKMMGFIQKTRVEEEKVLKRCGLVLQKMKATTIVQQNTSMDIKNGIKEVKELLNLITHQRNCWKTAKEELRKKHIDVAALSCTKRGVFSPPEREQTIDKGRQEENKVNLPSRKRTPWSGVIFIKLKESAFLQKLLEKSSTTLNQ